MVTEFGAPSAQPAPRGWPLFLFGVLVFFAGPLTYAVQLGVLHQTVMPWANIVLPSVGVLIMALSLVRRFSIWRTLGFVFFLVLAALQWVFLLVMAKTPLYTGPAQPGSELPAFATKFADGRSFSNNDLGANDNTIFLFFRGHW
jgi:hypothetical protein